MIEVITLGRVSDVVLNFVKSCISEVMKAFDIDPRMLRLVLAESRERLDEFIGSFSAQPLSSVFHLHVAGRPTILVVASELYHKSEVVIKGELLIALAHAKLHGSEEYYTIKPPKSLQVLLDYGVLEELVMTVLYLVASGVKGYEATRFIVSKGYVEEMVEVHKLHLRITPEERAYWTSVEGDFQAQALLALNTFKALANALPVYDFSEELGELFGENLALIPIEFRPSIERALFDVLPREPQTTFNRIEACLEVLSEVIYTALT